MKERGIAFLAGLWRLLATIWTLVIVSALAGALGNIIYTFATTGTVTFGNLHNFTSWISANLAWIIIVFLIVLALTICAYISHLHQVRELQKQQQAKDERLINTLDALKTNHPADTVASQTKTTQSTEAWNVPYLRNPFFTGREELLEQLHDNLTQNKSAALTQAQARQSAALVVLAKHRPPSSMPIVTVMNTIMSYG